MMHKVIAILPDGTHVTIYSTGDKEEAQYLANNITLATIKVEEQ